MDFRSMLDQVKQAFVIGKNNPFLHGRQGRQAEEPAYEDTGWQQPQQGQYHPQQEGYPPQQAPYQQPQSGQYAPPQQAWQPPQEPWQRAAPQPSWQQPQHTAPGQPWQQPMGYQQAQEAPVQPEPQHSFVSQFNPEPARETSRNRRAQQSQQPPAQQASYQPPAPPENLVPFPGAALQEQKQMDAYVINVFNINSCRQAMSCLRKGQCTLIVMDQLIDKAEIRRYVDMLTGACYALGGTMTRLSAKIGFYIMAPSGMTVYTDPTTTGANQQPRPQAQPMYRADATPGAAPDRAPYDFSPQGGYAPPQMQFSAHQPQQPAQQPQEGQQQEQPQQPSFNPWQEQHQQPYAASH